MMGETSPSREPDHRLIEQGKSFRHSTGVDHHPALHHQSLSDQVVFAEPATRLDHQGGRLGGPGKVPAAELLEELVGEQVPTFDDVFGFGLEQPLRSGDPAASHRRFPSGVQQQTEPRGEARGSDRIPIPDPVLVSGLQRPYSLQCRLVNDSEAVPHDIRSVAS
jgi:hypothetical protein